MKLFLDVLTLPVPCISESCIEVKVKLNFYFHTSLWCLRRFYEGLTKKCENENLTVFSLCPGLRREGLIFLFKFMTCSFSFGPYAFVRGINTRIGKENCNVSPKSCIETMFVTKDSINAPKVG